MNATISELWVVEFHSLSRAIGVRTYREHGQLVCDALIKGHFSDCLFLHAFDSEEAAYRYSEEIKLLRDLLKVKPKTMLAELQPHIDGLNSFSD